MLCLNFAYCFVLFSYFTLRLCCYVLKIFNINSCSYFVYFVAWFKRAILQSGFSTSPWSMAKEPKKNVLKLAQSPKLNCLFDLPADMMNCLREKTARLVQKFVIKPQCASYDWIKTKIQACVIILLNVSTYYLSNPQQISEN